MTPRYLALLIVLGCGSGCGSANPGAPASDGGMPEADATSEGGLPLSDGGSIPVPAACQVAATGAPPFQVTVRFRNTGQRRVFFANTYACSVAATISSCAASHGDVLNALAIHCPCEGTCPVGGPGCSATGIGIGPGERQELVWQASIVVLGTKAGSSCARGFAQLPAGRYRVTAQVFATAEQAIAGTPVLRTLQKDFELPAPDNLVDLTFAVD